MTYLPSYKKASEENFMFISHVVDVEIKGKHKIKGFRLIDGRCTKLNKNKK